MTRVSYIKNRRFLNEHKESHPYACHTRLNYPTSVDIRVRIPRLPFVSAPLIHHTEWRFITAEDRALFMTVFVAKIIVDNPKEHEVK